MGLRGFPPKPTVIEMLEGNPRKQKVNRQEPRPGLIMPTCPPQLDAGAKREWKRLAPLLYELGLLTEVDYICLGQLCQAYSTQAQAQRMLNKTGLLVKNPGGIPVQNPMLRVVNEQSAIIDRLCRGFGLNPAYRASMRADPVRAAGDDIQSQLYG